MNCPKSTQFNIWFCSLMGALIVCSILACDEPVSEHHQQRFLRAYALDSLVDIQLPLSRGEVILGVESMDDSKVQLTEQSDKTLTFKALAVGKTDFVIKTNRNTYVHSIFIEEVQQIQMETQCGTQPNGFDDAFRMVLPGATLQTRYRLFSHRALLGRDHVSLPLSTETSYHESVNEAETVMVYQVPEDSRGRWSLHATAPRGWFVANLTTIEQGDIDAFELYPYPNKSASMSGPPTASLQVNTTGDFSLVPMHNGFKVCGLNLNTINAQTTTPEVCAVTLAIDALQQASLTYDVLRVEGLREGECIIEVLDGRGEVWASTSIDVR